MANKYRYYNVTTTSVVKANSQTDAILATQRKRGVDAQVLSSEVSAERISAAEAQV